MNRKLVFLYLLLFSLFSCTKKQEPDFPILSEDAGIQSLSIEAVHPKKNIFWNVSFQKSPSSSYPGLQWEVSESSSSTPWLDVYADGNRVENIIQKIKTLGIPERSTQRGTPESFQLSPAWFTIKILDHTLYLGEQDQTSSGKLSFLWFSSSSPSSILQGTIQPFLSSSVLRAILEEWNQVDDVRLKKLLPWELDQVDQFEISFKNKRVLYERNGHRFQNSKSHNMKDYSYSDELKSIFQTRITSFVDDPLKQKEIKSTLSILQVSLKGRKKFQDEFKLYKPSPKEVYVEVKSRGNLVFKVEKKFLEFFQKSFH